ncbi:hypothetical protein SLS61_000831 [Didymella pomorum]
MASTIDTIFLRAPDFQRFKKPPRVMVIGAGSRGTAYAEAALQGTNAIIAGVCEPVYSKRETFLKRFIKRPDLNRPYPQLPAQPGEMFFDWQQWVEWIDEYRDGDIKNQKFDAIDVAFGWWHFSHSYVRGNWRKESTSAPSLLTKSCHDIDFLMWMFCTPDTSASPPHLPSTITSTGSLKYFRKSRKPVEAGSATNCLSCAYEPSCSYSAKKIYLEKQLAEGNADWPVKIVNPEIEDIYRSNGLEAASSQLLTNLTEDYDSTTPLEVRNKKNYFGRCVWESDNDVCDDQIVTLTWDDDGDNPNRGAKTALFHMIAHTEKQCERRGRMYGTKGEIEYDSITISVHDFATGETSKHVPHAAGGGHGGGDAGLVRQFLMAVDAVEQEQMSTHEAQRAYLGCDLEEAFLSHAVVFAAEDARTQKKVVDWATWWEDNVESQLQ